MIIYLFCEKCNSIKKIITSKHKSEINFIKDNFYGKDTGRWLCRRCQTKVALKT